MLHRHVDTHFRISNDQLQPGLSGNSLSVRDMGWFYHTMGVFAFALNAVAQIDTVHGVVGAFCVGVGISGPQEWLDLLGIRLTLTVCKGSGGTYVRTQMCSI